MRYARLTCLLLVVALVGSAGTAEAHKLTLTKAKQALRAHAASVARDLDGAPLTAGERLVVTSFGVAPNRFCLRRSRHRVWCPFSVEGVVVRTDGAGAESNVADWVCVHGATARYPTHRSRRVRVREDRDVPNCGFFPTAAAAGSWSSAARHRADRLLSAR